MVAGIERYFQIVRCFRDEDLRADRQPEFTQIDVEMSFVRPRRFPARSLEPLMAEIWRRRDGREAGAAVPAGCAYADAIASYGSDKPDLRCGMELVDVSRALREASFPCSRRSSPTAASSGRFAFPEPAG